MTEAAKVQIVNTALGLTGQEPVTDLSDASLRRSVAAVKVLRVLDQARDTVLRRHLWLCAKAYDTLNPAAEQPANWRYPTTFMAPGDCLRVWEIGGDPWSDSLAGGWGARWELGTVETDASARTVIRAASSACGGAGALTSLDIAYVRRANWQALDAHVADAIAYEAAARSIYSITGKATGAADLARSAEQKVLLAIGIDGTQDGGQPPAAPSIPAAIRAMSR